jgi:hypothetical protein
MHKRKRGGRGKEKKRKRAWGPATCQKNGRQLQNPTEEKGFFREIVRTSLPRKGDSENKRNDISTNMNRREFVIDYIHHS